MVKNTSGFLKNFLTSRDGNISVLTAISMLVIVPMTAIAIDSTRLMQASSKLKNLNDMAALAATTGQNKTIQERKKVYENIMELGLQNSSEVSGYEYELSIQDNDLTQVLVASSKSKANLLFPLANSETKFVTAHSEVTVGKEFVEIALVLDISTSMEGPRMVELKRSAQEFMDVIMGDQAAQGRVSISLVPFGGTVRLPEDLETLLIPPATTDKWVNGEWNGCLSIPTADYVSGVTPQHELEYMPDFYAWANPWCPEQGNELMGLSRNKAELSNRIDTLSLSDGTGTDIGVTWGLATLDPIWRNEIKGGNSNAPRDFHPQTKKIMVVMADGGVTNQRLPLENDMVGAPPFKTKNEVNATVEAENGYQNICELTKNKGIEIYTVGFQIVKKAKLEMLQSCGTSEAHNFEAKSGQLSTAFLNIASSISGIRLSK